MSIEIVLFYFYIALLYSVLYALLCIVLNNWRGQNKVYIYQKKEKN